MHVKDDDDGRDSGAEGWVGKEGASSIHFV